MSETAVFLESSAIDVYPSTRRSFHTTQSRQTTEANLAGLINKLIDKDGFVVTDISQPNYDYINNPFEFNIHGYYFRTTVNNLTDLFDGDINENLKTIFAEIELDTSSNIPEFYELNAGDDGGYYKGICFDITSGTIPATVPGSKYVLPLLNCYYNNTTLVCEIPTESRFKFSLPSLNIDEIDGGIIG